MTSIRIDNNQSPTLTKNGQLHLKKVTENEMNNKSPQLVSPAPSSQQQISQLTQLLMKMNVLQRLFTTFTAHSSVSTGAPPTLISNLFSQLLLPQNQTVLIQWLQQGAGKDALNQLIKQSTQVDSPLKQWLQEQPTDKQDEFRALLKLAVEQRLAPATKDNEITLLQLHLLQPNGRELLLSVERDSRSGTKEKNAKRPQWTVKLDLPVGSYDVVHTIAIWDQQKLALSFESENIQLLKRTEILSPLLTERLTMLGIRSEPANFKVRQSEVSEPSAGGFSILV